MNRPLDNKHLRDIIRRRYRTIGIAADIWGVSRVTVHNWLRRGEITYEGGQTIKNRGISLVGLPVESAPNKGGYPKHSRRKEHP